MKGTNQIGLTQIVQVKAREGPIPMLEHTSGFDFQKLKLKLKSKFYFILEETELKQDSSSNLCVKPESR